MAKAKVNKIQSNGEFDPKVSVKGEESGRIWQLTFFEELLKASKEHPIWPKK